MANKKKVMIKYTSRDFDSIKTDLIDYAKRYYADTYKDFNEASFGSLMLDMTSYVGDILSFYLDYQANESFMETAVEYDNIIKHGRPFGHKFRGNPSSFGKATLFINVPASTTTTGPDLDYLPVLTKGSEFTTVEDVGFLLNEDVDFSNSDNEVVVSEVDSDTGVPISYAVKAYGEVISGEMIEETFQIGAFQKFLRVQLAGDDIAEVLSIHDSEGHEFFEVDYLSQNVIYKYLTNRNADKDLTAMTLKPMIVPRRFVVEQESEQTFIQFGYGSSDEIRESSVVDPSEVVLRRYGKNYITDDTFDPTNLISTDKFGVAPSSTTLRVVSRNNGSENVNASVNSLTEVNNPIFEFDNAATLNAVKTTSVVGSLEITNEDPIVGDVSLPESVELKRRIYDTFASQNRAVTAQDYTSIVYQMPPQLGAIKRCVVRQDKDSFKRNLNLYIISEAADGTLASANSTLKNNVKTWLQKNKMVNDTIDILNAYIVNVGINFEIIVNEDKNRFFILNDAIAKLKEEFQSHFDIGEDFSITDVYSALKKVDGVVDTVKVDIVHKVGGNYSDTSFDVEENMSPDGRLIVVPENVIVELKFPNLDIVGSIR